MKQSKILIIVIFLIGITHSQHSRSDDYSVKDSPDQEDSSVYLRDSQSTRKLRPKNRAARNPASLPVRSQQSFLKVNRQYRPIKLKLGLLAGMSLAETYNTYTTEDSLLQSDRTISLGLMADFRAYKYLGAEADLHYSFKSVHENTLHLETDINAQQNRSFRGGLFNIKGQFPVPIKSVLWTPKLGIGWGVEMIVDEESQSDATETLLTSSQTTQVAGPYAMAGFDLLPFNHVTLGMDYSQSFGASGSVDLGSGDDSTHYLLESSFSRLRIGASYQISSKFSLGAQYTWRKLFYNFSTGDQSSTSSETSHNQLMGFIMLGL